MINGKTQLIGLIGWPVAHSFSPAMHNAAAAALGLNWCYLPLPVPPDKLEAAVRGLPALSFRGVNVTIPHKQAVIPFLDEIDPAAKAIGAVNTIVVGEKMVGYNTDYSGFLTDLQTQGVEIAGKECWVMGAGGSARAIVFALLQAGAKVTIFARRLEQARGLAVSSKQWKINSQQSTVNSQRLANTIHNSQFTIHNSPSLIINTTPLGMSPHTNASIWPDDVPLPAGCFVYDLVYNPAMTKLMKQAENAWIERGRNAGIPTSNGLGMLLQQAAQAFTLWTGQTPDLTVMLKALKRFAR